MLAEVLACVPVFHLKCQDRSTITDIALHRNCYDLSTLVTANTTLKLCRLSSLVDCANVKLLRLVCSSHWMYDAETVETGLFLSLTLWRWNCWDWSILVTNCMTLKLLRLVYSSHWLCDAETVETGLFLSLTVWHKLLRLVHSCHWQYETGTVKTATLVTDCVMFKTLRVCPFSSLTARLTLGPLTLVHTEIDKTGTHLSLTAHY